MGPEKGSLPEGRSLVLSQRNLSSLGTRVSNNLRVPKKSDTAGWKVIKKVMVDSFEDLLLLPALSYTKLHESFSVIYRNRKGKESKKCISLDHFLH